MTSRTAAHRAIPPRAAMSVVSMAKAGAVLVVALLISLSAVGGTYATLSSSQSIALVSSSGATTTTITAGTATLTVNGDAISMSNLYPGLSRTADFTVNNTGDTALAIGVDSIAGVTAANGLTATVASGTCAAAGAGVSSGSLATTIASKGSAALCLTVGMSVSAPAAAQGQSSTVTVSLTGTQP